jgi:hypothetical protein
MFYHLFAPYSPAIGYAIASTRSSANRYDG